jgi:hypothetical protein
MIISHVSYPILGKGKAEAIPNLRIPLSISNSAYGITGHSPDITGEE